MFSQNLGGGSCRPEIVDIVDSDGNDVQVIQFVENRTKSEIWNYFVRISLQAYYITLKIDPCGNDFYTLDEQVDKRISYSCKEYVETERKEQHIANNENVYKGH